MNLEAAFRLRRGELDLDVDLVVPGGSVTAVLGPNGAGKTTLVAAVAGHVAIDTGRIALGDVELDVSPRTFVAPEARRLGLVHQEHLLFPHLTALENVAFAPRARGVPAPEARARAAALLERMGVGALAHARPRSLSGGQAQRVALARALAAEPLALLLDEPLAALDAGTRAEVRRDLRRHLADVAGPTVLVTHDPVDALALADAVAIVEEGRIVQQGPLAEVTARPRSRHVADLIGTNLLHGVADGTGITTDTGLAVTAADAHRGPVFATIPPAALALHRREPEGSPRNRWRGRVDHLDRLGDRVRVRLAPPIGLVAEITAAAAAELDLREGSEVWASVKATEIAAYPR